MNLIEENEIYEIAEAFVVANTPASFYRWLENEASVRRLSRDTDESKLRSELKMIMDKEEKSEIEISLAYAILMAIILKQRERCEFPSMLLKESNLDWASDFWELADQKYIPSTIVVVSPGLKGYSNIDVKGLADSARATIYDGSGKPVIKGE